MYNAGCILTEKMDRKSENNGQCVSQKRIQEDVFYEVIGKHISNYLRFREGRFSNFLGQRNDIPGADGGSYRCMEAH